MIFISEASFSFSRKLALEARVESWLPEIESCLRRSNSRHLWVEMTEWLNTAMDGVRASGPYIWAACAWVMLAAGFFGGLVGVFIPIIPGAIVLFGAAVIHKWMLPELLSWWGIGILFGMVILDRVVDFSGAALGTKWFGGSKWGVIGALIGGFFGLFFGIIGILIGPVIGAIVFEMAKAKAHPKAAAKSGVGAGVGFGLSALGKLGVCFAMYAVIMVDAYIGDDPAPEELEPEIEAAPVLEQVHLKTLWLESH